jgi:putative flippase GtrA
MNLPRQFFVFCFVGVISVAVDLVTLLELVQLEVPPLIAVTISFIAEMLVNIWLHAN